MGQVSLTAAGGQADVNVLVMPLQLQKPHIAENIQTGHQLSQIQRCAGPADDLAAQADGIFPDAGSGGGQVAPHIAQGHPVRQQLFGGALILGFTLLNELDIGS